MLSWIPIASCLTKNNGMQPMLTNFTKDYDPCPPAFVSGTNYKSRDVVSIPISPGSESGEVYMCKTGAARLYCNIYPPTWKRLSPDGQTAHLIQDLGWEKKGKCGDPLPTMPPTQAQTEWPTMSPTQAWTEIPSMQNSEIPSTTMTEMPSAEMTEIPSMQMTAMPSAQITALPSTQTTELVSTQADPQVTMRPTMRPSPVASMGETKPVGGRSPSTLSPVGSSPSTTPSPTVTSPSTPTSGGTNPTSTSTNALGPSTMTSGGYTGGTSPSITSFISNQSPSHAYQPSNSDGIPSAVSSPVGASTLAPSSSVEKTAPAQSVYTSPTTTAAGMTYFTDGRSKPAGGRRSTEPDEDDDDDSFSSSPSSPELTSPYGVIKFVPSKEVSDNERPGLNEGKPISTNEGRYKIFKSPQDDREVVIHEEDDDFIQISEGDPHCWRSGTECNSYAEDFACCTGGCVDGYCQ